MLHEQPSSWTQLVSLLARPACEGSGAKTASRTRQARRRCAPDISRSATVRILDRPTLRTLIVSWRDALTGNYGHQVWNAKKASRCGICAISGRLIERGDDVFSPRAGNAPPSNSGAMITAECLQHAVLST